MTRTITNPANNSNLSSSTIRSELQTLENEISSGADPGHTHTIYAPIAGPTFTGTVTIPTLVVNTGATLPVDQPLTTPKVTTSIKDANGNEVIKTPATSSAINEVTITNAAIGNAPEVSATGDDTNIGLKLTSKGTGAVESTTKHVFDKNAYFSVVDNGNSGTSKTIDWTAGNKQKITFTGNPTLTFTAPSGPCNLNLECIQDGTVRTITWPASVKWPAGTSPTMTGTSGRSDIISFYYNGTVYYATSSLNHVNS